jgi:outer membrane lipoprotein-sorting protein
MNQIAEQAVPDRLDLWPAIQARVDEKTARQLVEMPNATGPRLLARRPLVGLAAAAVLALAVGATFSLWTRTDTVSAQEILGRAAATTSGAPAAVTTYHLILRDHVLGKGNVTITTENWYGGASRRRSDNDVKDAQGATINSSGVIFDGNQTWIHHVENGQTQVIHTVGTTWTDPVDDPSGPTSLADVLARYGSDKQCMDVHQQGEATVANRPTYMIVATPKADCARIPSSDRQVAVASVVKPTPQELGATPKPTPNATVIAAKLSAAQSASKHDVSQLTVWVDKQTFLPLRTEMRDATGALLEQSEVTELQYNVAIPDATFTYTPPAGASVYNFTGGDGAQVKKAIFIDQATPQVAK